MREDITTQIDAAHSEQASPTTSFTNLSPISGPSRWRRTYFPYLYQDIGPSVYAITVQVFWLNEPSIWPMYGTRTLSLTAVWKGACMHVPDQIRIKAVGVGGGIGD